MIGYLTQLMEDGEFDKCLRLSEQMLLRGGMTMAEMAQVNFVICRCRVGLKDSYGAINSGLLAVKLARDVQEWDIMGRALLNVGTAYLATRQYPLALQHLYAYLEHLHLYTTAHRFEGAIWRTIGVAHQRNLESAQAIDALHKAVKWFKKHDADHSAFSCLHDLVHTYLFLNESKQKLPLDPVRALLEQEREFVHKYPEDPSYQGMYNYDRAAYYLRVKRYGRAMVCAMKTLEVSKADHQLSSNAHMVLYECCRDLGDAKQAMGYALAARVEAIQGRHYDLEFLAATAMTELIRRTGTEAIRELDVEYQAMGVDISKYVPATILRRYN